MIDITKNLGGAVTALVTPFDKSGKVNFPVLQKLIEYQLFANIDGLVMCGSTGEGPQLTLKERGDIIKHAVKLADAKTPIIVSTGAESIAAMKDNIAQARDLGADGILNMNCPGSKFTDNGLIDLYGTAASYGLPVTAYNIEKRSGQNLSTQVIKKLADLGYIIAVKDASGNLTQVWEVITQVKEKKEAKGEKFYVLSGDDRLTPAFMKLGADGVISVDGNANPERLVKLINAHKAGDLKTAAQAYNELCKITDLSTCDKNPIAIKAVLNAMGLDVGDTRGLGKVTAENQAIINSRIAYLKDQRYFKKSRTA